MSNQDRPPLTVSEREAAWRVGYAMVTLRSWRMRGRGPAYIRVGRSVRYRVSDLDEWLNRHVVETSESRSA